jgi:hypothetical protein
LKNSQALQQTLARLQDRVSRLGCPAVLASEAFGNGQALLEVAGEQTAIGALQVRCVPRVAQDQDDGLARGEPGAVAAVRAQLKPSQHSGPLIFRYSRPKTFCLVATTDIANCYIYA